MFTVTKWSLIDRQVDCQQIKPVQYLWEGCDFSCFLRMLSSFADEFSSLKHNIRVYYQRWFPGQSRIRFPFFPSSEWCIPPPLLLNTWYSLCKTTVGSHEINRLIFKWPANDPVGHAKTDFKQIPCLPGDQNEVYMRWKSPQCPAKARMGGRGAGFSNDWLPNKRLITKQLF